MLYRVFVFPQFRWALGFQVSLFTRFFLGKSSCFIIFILIFYFGTFFPRIHLHIGVHLKKSLACIWEWIGKNYRFGWNCFDFWDTLFVFLFLFVGLCSVGSAGEGAGSRESGREMDGWRVQWLETPELHDAIQIHCYNKLEVDWKNGEGAVVGNECEFAVGKTKSLSQAGWLAPLLLLSSSSGRTERERKKDFLVSPKSNVIFLFPIFPLSIYANLLMPRLCFSKKSPLPSPHSSPLSILIVESIFYFISLISLVRILEMYSTPLFIVCTVCNVLQTSLIVNANILCLFTLSLSAQSHETWEE